MKTICRYIPLLKYIFLNLNIMCCHENGCYVDISQVSFSAKSHNIFWSTRSTSSISALFLPQVIIIFFIYTIDILNISSLFPPQVIIMFFIIIFVFCHRPHHHRHHHYYTTGRCVTLLLGCYSTPVELLHYQWSIVSHVDVL